MNSQMTVVDDVSPTDFPYPWLWNGFGQDGGYVELSRDLPFLDFGIERRNLTLVTNCKLDESSSELLDISRESSKASLSTTTDSNCNLLEENIYSSLENVRQEESDDVFLWNDTNLFSVAANVEIDDNGVHFDMGLETDETSRVEINLDFSENQNTSSFCDSFSNVIDFDNEDFCFSSSNPLPEPSLPLLWTDHPNEADSNVAQVRPKYVKKPKRQKCPTCQRGFAYLKNLNKHLLSHNKKKRNENLDAGNNPSLNESLVQDVQILVTPVELIFGKDCLKFPFKLESSSYEFCDKTNKHRMSASNDNRSNSIVDCQINVSDVLKSQPTVRIEKMGKGLIEKYLDPNPSLQRFRKRKLILTSQSCNTFFSSCRLIAKDNNDDVVYEKYSYSENNKLEEVSLERKQRCSLRLQKFGTSGKYMMSDEFFTKFCATSDEKILDLPNNRQLRYRCMFCYRHFNEFLTLKSHMKTCTLPECRTLVDPSSTAKRHYSTLRKVQKKSRRRKKRCYEFVPFSLNGGTKMRTKIQTSVKNEHSSKERDEMEKKAIRKSQRRNSYNKDFYFLMQHGRPRVAKDRRKNDSEDLQKETRVNRISERARSTRQKSSSSEEEPKKRKKFHYQRHHVSKEMNDFGGVSLETIEASFTSVELSKMHACSTCEQKIVCGSSHLDDVKSSRISRTRKKLIIEKIMETCNYCKEVFKTAIESVQYYNDVKGSRSIYGQETSMRDRNTSAQNCNDEAESFSNETDTPTYSSTSKVLVVKRKRGRPRKVQVDDIFKKLSAKNNLIKRSRGRPRKVKILENHDIESDPAGCHQSISSVEKKFFEENIEKETEKNYFSLDGTKGDKLLNEHRNGTDSQTASTSSSSSDSKENPGFRYYNLRNGHFHSSSVKVTQFCSHETKNSLPKQFVDVESENLGRKTNFHCPYCLKCFPYYFTWRYHLSTHHGHQTVPCIFCDEFQPLRNAKLESHLRNHFDKNDTFRPKLIHRLVRILIQKDKVPALERNGIHVCGRCKNVFSSERALRRHLLREKTLCCSEERTLRSDQCLKDSANIHRRRRTLK